MPRKYYSDTTTCGKHLCSKPAYLEDHIYWAAVISWKSGTCSRSHSPCWADTAIRPNSCVHLNDLAKWPRGDSRVPTEHPFESPWWPFPAAVNLSAAFIGHLSSGMWALLRTGVRFFPEGNKISSLLLRCVQPPPHRAKGASPHPISFYYTSQLPTATILAHLYIFNALV